MVVTTSMTSNHSYMDLQQLRYVVAVADAASFTRGAARCHVTQSALSHRVGALERELGVRLFARTSRSVRLTEAGEAFLRSARVAVRAADQAREDAAAAGGEVVGTLRLGVIPTVTVLDVPRLLLSYRAAHPEARVELREGNSDALVTAVRDGDLDVALLGLRDGLVPQGVASRPLSRERLVAVLPPDHALAGTPTVDVHDLADAVFADFPAGTSGRAQSDAAFAAAGVSRDVAFESDTAAGLLGLVAAGLAVTLLAPGVVSAAGHAVATAEVRDGPVRVEHVAWDAVAPRSAARAFLRIVAAARPRQAASDGGRETGPGEFPEPVS